MPASLIAKTKKVTTYSWDELPKALADSGLQAEYQTLLVDYHRIFNRLFKGTKPKSTPTLRIVAGIPYSGKSAYIDKKCRQKDGITVSFDAIMAQLSLYQRLNRQDSELAFYRCERLAQIMGYQLLSQCIEQRRDVVFEHSSAPEVHVDLYRLIKEEFGYQVTMIYLDCSVELAKRRSTINNKLRDNQRFTPDAYIEQRAESLAERLKVYKQFLKVTVIK